MASPWRRTSASSRKRLSTLYWPSSTSATFTSSSSGRMSVRKPRLPRLIPSTGVLCRASARAAPSMLPSPPTTITRSQTSPRILREEVCRPWPGNTSAMVSSRITWRWRSSRNLFSRRMVSSTWGLPRRPMMPILRNCSMGLQGGVARRGMAELWGIAADSGKPPSAMLATCKPSNP
ncbi:hypothetical protein D3C72_1605860 [compost metagenome]